jgi:hypothetical protein
MTSEDKSQRPAVDEQDVVDSQPQPLAIDKATIQEAADRTTFEHNMSVRDAIKYYKWAIFWCLAVRCVRPPTILYILRSPTRS